MYEPRLRSGVWEEVGTSPHHHHHSHRPHLHHNHKGHRPSQSSSQGSWCSGSGSESESSLDEDDEVAEAEDEDDGNEVDGDEEEEEDDDDEETSVTTSSGRSVLEVAATTTAAINNSVSSAWTSAATRVHNGQLRNTLNKAKTLCDKLRGGGGGGGGGSVSSSSKADELPSRLSRWFSMRRGSAHQYDIDGIVNGTVTATAPTTLPTVVNAAAAAATNTNSLGHLLCNNGGGGFLVNGNNGKLMPLLSEVAEDDGTLFTCTPQQRRHVPPTLPPPPPDLAPAQLKRRMIVAAIVHSENSYVATLQRLVNDYKKPLEESSPAILSSSKISTLFHRLPEILQCHTLFRIALAESVRNWDKEERIGDVFVASFSKAIVLDIYSGFINNFSMAMDMAKMEAKRKSALADFLKVKQISSHDRLSFFGLMVKPVQRFPQFILFLQDLLKHTPQGHHDRMSLQLALTQLESLAEMLNERKREAEQYQAFKEMLRHIGSKFSARPLLSDLNRYLLREDNVIQLEYNQNGQLSKAKNRRLLLLNDLVVCLSVSAKASAGDDLITTGSNSSSSSTTTAGAERLHLKWTHPVTDLEICDTSTSPTLSRVLTAAAGRVGSLKSSTSMPTTTPTSTPTPTTNLLQSSEPASSIALPAPSTMATTTTLCSEMSSLMHDYEIVSRINDLVGHLNGTYKDLTVEHTRRLLHQIQSSIQQKDEEMAWADSCCLQLVLHTAKGKEETRYTFRANSPAVKKEWMTELRLAQLALDPNNSPAWEVPEQEQRPSTKMPLFVRPQSVYQSQHQTEVRCGCYYTLSAPPKTLSSPSSSSSSSAAIGRRRHKHHNSYLWICTTDGASTHIAILTQHAQQASVLKDVCSFSLVETQVTAIEFVRGHHNGRPPTPDTVWMGTDSHRLLLFAAAEPDRQQELASIQVQDTITSIKSHGDSVLVSLNNGTLHIYRRDTDNNNDEDDEWQLKCPQTIQLGSEPVSSVLPINQCVYVACGKKVSVLNASTGDIQKSFSIQHEHVGNVNLMAHSGIGLWISLKHSSTICLYHTETFKHLQDINIASNVMRVTTPQRDCCNSNRSQVNVTALLACKGLLWVGTNVGIALTIPLPRLEGVPIISGRVNISYHAHFGPITFLLALQPRGSSGGGGGSSSTATNNPSKEEHTIEEKPSSLLMQTAKLDDPQQQQQKDEKQKQQQQKCRHFSSPVMVRRRRRYSGDAARLSKTLPRSTGGSVFSTSSTSSADTCDVYGLYGQLMYIRNYDEDDEDVSSTTTQETTGGGQEVVLASHRRRNSDPDLAVITNKVNTLDRKLKLKANRPRSLDLSNWSIGTTATTTSTTSSGSTGSEESMAALRRYHHHHHHQYHRVRNGGKLSYCLDSRCVSRNNSNVSGQMDMSSTSSTAGEGEQLLVSPGGSDDATTPLEVRKCEEGAQQNNNSSTKSGKLATPENKMTSCSSNSSGGNPVTTGENARRTVMTLMGGRGYVNFRQPCCPADKSKASFSIRESNRNDAHIVIWELKL